MVVRVMGNLTATSSNGNNFGHHQPNISLPPLYLSFIQQIPGLQIASECLWWQFCESVNLNFSHKYCDYQWAEICSCCCFQARKRHICEICFKTYSRSSHMKRHVREVHMQIRDHHCPDCDRSFAAKEVLTDHILRKHTKEKQFHCEECPKSFATKRDLRDHAKKRHKQC